MSLFIFWSGIIAAIATSLYYQNWQKNKSRFDNFTKHIRSLDGFTPTQQVCSITGESGLAIDEINQKVCLVKSCGDDFTSRTLDYADIFSSELVQNGRSITKTERTSQIGGALIGGLVMGGAGAVIGGLSGQSTTSQEIQSILLRVVVDDTSDPQHLVLFYYNSGNNPFNLASTELISLSRHWSAIMDIIIKRVDRERTSASGPHVNN